MVQKLNIGIIGGTGEMGKFFARYFKQLGHDVAISGVNAKKASEVSKLYNVAIKSNREIAEDSDIIIYSVPMDKTIEVIKETAPYAKPGSLLTDFTSVKVEPVNAMLKYSKKDVEVIGIHPVFSPAIKSMLNQVVVLCPVRTKKWLPVLKNLFRKSKARITIATAQQHDEMMAIIQVLTHFNNITLGHTLKELNFDFMKSLEYTSPNYKLNLQLVGRILNQNPAMYADIEIMNPIAKTVLKAHVKSVKKLRKIVKRKDREAFAQYFQEAADYLGDFRKTAMIDTNKLIEKIAESEQ